MIVLTRLPMSRFRRATSSVSACRICSMSVAGDAFDGVEVLRMEVDVVHGGRDRAEGQRVEVQRQLVANRLPDVPAARCLGRCHPCLAPGPSSPRPRGRCSDTMHGQPPRSPKGFPRICSTRMRVAFGRFTFDTDTRELLDAGTRVHLSPKAFDLLELLLDRRPTVVSKREIHDQVWQDTFVSDANLSVVIAEIRQVLGDDSRQAGFIRTVHRVGYAFSGPAQDLAAVRPAAAPKNASAGWSGTTAAFPLALGENVARARSALRALGRGVGRLAAARTARRRHRVDDHRRSRLQQRHLRGAASASPGRAARRTATSSNSARRRSPSGPGPTNVRRAPSAWCGRSRSVGRARHMSR